MKEKPSPIPVLLGPTGSGKTGLVSDLDADLFEVVSVDSRQIFRGLEISSAAPSISELAQMPHHLVSVLSPNETVDAAWFVQKATQAILDIQGRGKIPILVGGAGFYFLALESGGLRHPPAPPEVREKLLSLEKEGRRRLFEKYFPDALCSPSGSPKKDRLGRPPGGVKSKPAFLQKPIHPNDDYRITRALEIALTEELMCQLNPFPKGLHGKIPNNSQMASLPRFRFTGWWLNPPKEKWWQALDARVQKMLEAGMVEEVLSVYEHFGDCPGLKSLGCLEVVQKYATTKGHSLTKPSKKFFSQGSDFLELKERIVILHRQYGKRQRTWFRNKTSLEEILPEEFQDKISRFVENNIKGTPNHRPFRRSFHTFFIF